MIFLDHGGSYLSLVLRLLLKLECQDFNLDKGESAAHLVNSCRV